MKPFLSFGAAAIFIISPTIQHPGTLAAFNHGRLRKKAVLSSPYSYTCDNYDDSNVFATELSLISTTHTPLSPFPQLQHDFYSLGITEDIEL
jgi:hypothetical protein